jgi:hypothetical protein
VLTFVAIYEWLRKDRERKDRERKDREADDAVLSHQGWEAELHQALASSAGAARGDCEHDQYVGDMECAMTALRAHDAALCARVAALEAQAAADREALERVSSWFSENAGWLDAREGSLG